MLRKNTLYAVALAGLFASSASHALPFGLKKEDFYFKAGLTQIAPDVDSSPLMFYGLNDIADAALDEGPIEGTGTDVSTETMPSLTIGYILPWGGRHLSIETILAPPFEFDFYATGRARYESLAPETPGDPGIQTGVPPLGKTLGTTKMLPPTVTFVYNLFPESTIRPYVGAGLSYVFSFDEEITNPVLNEVQQPDIEISDPLAWVVQAGIDIDIYKNFFLGLDVKYVGGAEVEAVVENIVLDTSVSDLFDEYARVERNVVEQELNPTIYQLTLGYRF